MKEALSFCCFILFFSPLVWAIDEADLPPPPMPEYMRKANYKPNDGSLSQASPVESESGNLDNQSVEEIKQEFLQAGKDEFEEDSSEVVDLVEEGSMEDTGEESLDLSDESALSEVIEASTPQPSANEVPAEIANTDVRDEDVQEALEADKAATLLAENDEGEDGEEDEEGESPAEEGDSEEEEDDAKMAAVEKKLEASEAEQRARLLSERKPASLKKFKSGMYKFAKKCTMRSEPSRSGDQAGFIRAGRKLWIDAHDGNWHKAYKKNGTVYISADCLK